MVVVFSFLVPYHVIWPDLVYMTHGMVEGLGKRVKLQFKIVLAQVSGAELARSLRGETENIVRVTRSQSIYNQP